MIPMVLMMLLQAHPPLTLQDFLHLVDNGIATIIYAMNLPSLQSIVHKANLGKLAFSWDMLLNVLLIEKLQTQMIGVKSF